ncbi:MAG: glycerate kinase, partial [Thermoanaerobacteraceae bacterium]|nr:glycerate kinase [Thermoanaerobacteraceae bacterium]
MRVIISPDSYKGSLTSKQVCNAIEEGLKRSGSFDIVKIPIADGGEGTVDAFLSAVGGELVEVTVTAPLGDRQKSFYGILKDGTCVIEMAAASGLSMVAEDRRNPLVTTTYGTGELIKDALDRGCKNFIIGIGGSATNDCGAGMLQALGVRITDESGNEIGFGGGELGRAASIDISGLDKRIAKCHFTVACDVDNPLCGEKGASAVYGPQKGATKEMVALLDRNLSHFADLSANAIGRDYRNYPGAGAAGGLGFAFKAFLNADIKRGIDVAIEATHLEDLIKDADIVITGEGNTDFQTARFGKAPAGIAKIGKRYGKPVVIISGGLGESYKELYDAGVTALFSITSRPMSLKEAMDRGYEL